MKKTLFAAALILGSLTWAAEPQSPTASEPVTSPTPAPGESAPEAGVAAPSPEVASESRPPSLELALKLGGHFPQLLSKLETSFNASLTVGYAPFEGRQVQFLIGVGYSQPSRTITTQDPRLGATGATYTSTLTMRDLTMTVGGKYFFLPPTRFIVPYAGAGLRIHFMRGDVEGNGGADFGKYNETDTRFGFVVFGGAGLHLGPGLVLAELAFNYAPIGQRVTGDANVGALAVVVGYGLLLF